MVKYKEKIAIKAIRLLKEQLIKFVHDSYIEGYTKIQNTYRRLKAHIYWPIMKKLMQRIVQQCDICKQAKAKRVDYLGLL